LFDGYLINKDGLDLANGRRSRQSSFHESNSCRGIDSSSDVTYPLGERRILSHDDDDGDNDEETISLEEVCRELLVSRDQCDIKTP
jgi:hypothetical protein